MFRCSLVLPHFFVSFHIFDRAFSNKTFWKLDISNSQTSTEHKNVIVSTFHHGCCKLGGGLLIIIIYNNKLAFLVLKLVDKKSHYKMTQRLTDIKLLLHWYLLKKIKHWSTLYASISLVSKFTARARRTCGYDFAVTMCPESYWSSGLMSKSKYGFSVEIFSPFSSALFVYCNET